MDSETGIKLLILLFLLVLSAFFSSSETALMSVSHVRLKTLADGGNKRAARALKAIDNRQKMLSAILIGNNLVNIGASSLATILAIDVFGSYGAGIATGVLTFLILIFGEISPKTLASLEATRLSLRVAGIILALMWILTPIIVVLDVLVTAFLRLIGVSRDEEAAGMTSQELRTVVDLSHESGTIEDDEKEYIHNVFDFSDSMVREIMIPRIDMTMVNVMWSYDKILEVFSEENRFTRMPVYEEETDNIIGILNMKDLLLCEKNHPFSVRNHMREAHFTFEQKNTAELFEEMRENSISMSIVLDEYGALAGLITLEDLLEELVGEIRDEFDEYEVDDITRINDTEFDVLGSTNLDDLCDALPLDFESEDYDTIGGYLIGLLDHFPTRGETYTTEDSVELRAQVVKKNRVEKIRIRFPMPIVDNKREEEKTKEELPNV